MNQIQINGESNQEEGENLIDFFLDNSPVSQNDLGEENLSHEDSSNSNRRDRNENSRRDPSDNSDGSDESDDSNASDNQNQNESEEDEEELTIEELKENIMRLESAEEINNYLETIIKRKRDGVEWNIERREEDTDILRLGFKKIGLIRAGVGICKECCKYGTTGHKLLEKHYQAKHRNKVAENIKLCELLGKMLRKEETMYWMIDNEDKSKRVFLSGMIRCPICWKLVSKEVNISRHISQAEKKKHPDISEDKAKLGWFWTIVRRAWRNNEEIPKVRKFLEEKEIYICPYCDFGTSDLKGIKSHERDGHNIGTRDPTKYKIVKIMNLAMINEGRRWDLNEIKAKIQERERKGKEDLEKSWNKQRGIDKEEERDDEREIDENDIGRRELIREREDRKERERKRKEQDIRKAVGIAAYERTQRRENGEEDDQRKDENENQRQNIYLNENENQDIIGEVIDNDDEENDNNNKKKTEREEKIERLKKSGPQKSTEEILRICRKACNDYERMEDKGICIPPMHSYRMHKILKPLNMAVDELEEFQIEAMKHLKEDYEQNMIILEGLECKFTMEILRVIKEKLRIGGKDTSQSEINRENRLTREELEKMKKVTVRSKGLNKVIGYFMEIKEKFKNRSIYRLEQSERNWLEKKIEEIKEIIIKSGGSEIIRKIYGVFTRDMMMEIIDNMLAGEMKEIEWLREELRREQEEIDGDIGKKYKKIVRNMYREDGKRCLRYYIIPSEIPDCRIPIDEIEDFYKRELDQTEMFRQDLEENWNIKEEDKISEEDKEWIKKQLINEDNIKIALMSRDNLSACGNDGIANVIWKYSKRVTIPLIKELVKNMYNSGKCPQIWKRSKTILIYKKGAPNENRSWRPISLTLTLYRAAMCHLSNVLQSIKFLSPQQKGFRRGIDGASEHINVIDQLMARAKANRESLYIMTLDFKNAFGSVPHEMILGSMKRFGFSENLIKMAEALYDRATTRIWIRREATEEIQIRRGVKQGCPMSPWFFNLCIDILLRWLDKENYEDGVCLEVQQNGKQIKYNFVAQAYADDVILISPTHSGMQNILRSVDKFCEWSKMELAPQKCHCVHYAFVDKARTIAMEKFEVGIDKMTGRKGLVDCGGFDETIEYLGIKVGFWSSVKKRKMKDTVNKIVDECEKIIRSVLTFSQKIDCLKRRILTKLDYALLNGNFPVTLLEEADQKIRAMIDEELKSPGLPIDLFYMSWRDGGLDLPNLVERYRLLQIRNFMKLTSSPDERVRALEKIQWENECKKRKIKPDENSPFIEVPVNELGGINYGEGTKVDCLHIRAARAVKGLNLQLRRIEKDGGYEYYLKNGKEEKENKNEENENEDENVRNRNNRNENNRNENDEDDDDKVEGTKVDYISFLKMAGAMIKENHYNRLVKEYKMKGQAFIDIRNDIISNHFMRDEGQMMRDEDVKFAILARTLNIYTPAKAKQNILCKYCGQERKLTLNHIINGCRGRFNQYTERHNEVQKVFRNYLEKKLKKKDIIIRENCTIKIGDRGLTGEEGNLKPDLWYIEDKKITIVEFTFPFGQNTRKRNGIEQEDEEESRTVIRARREKSQKYERLIEKCKEELELDTEYYIIIISSLGAVPEKTLTDLKKIFGVKKYQKIAREMVRKVISESRKIYLDWRRKEKKQDNNSERDDNNIENIESDDNNIRNNNENDENDEDNENYHIEENEEETKIESYIKDNFDIEEYLDGVNEGDINNRIDEETYLNNSNTTYKESSDIESDENSIISSKDNVTENEEETRIDYSNINNNIIYGTMYMQNERRESNRNISNENVFLEKDMEEIEKRRRCEFDDLIQRMESKILTTIKERRGGSDDGGILSENENNTLSGRVQP